MFCAGWRRTGGTRDGSKAQFSQPTGICFDMKTLFTVDTSTGTLRMTSDVNSLVEYLKHLHLFAETFEMHIKKEAPPEITTRNRETKISLSI